MDDVLFTVAKKVHYRSNKVKKSLVFLGFLSKEFTALSNEIKCQTVSSVDDSPALII